MLEIHETKWVIMDKWRTVIAKGSPRNRWLIPIDDPKDKKRVLYYSSKKMAESGFSTGFYTATKKQWREYQLEAVEVKLSITEVIKPLPTNV